MKKKIKLIAITLLSTLIASCQTKVSALPLEKLKLPPGFKVEVYTDQVWGARSLTLSDKGTLFVGTIVPNVVYALPDKNHDGKPDSVITLIKNLNHPNGVAFKDGSLYVAEIGRLLRYDNIEANLNKAPKPVVLNKNFPKDEWHGYRYIAFGPDGMLYVPIGAPCNTCLKPEDPRYATLTRLKPDGTKQEVFARGIRNTVGFDWHPKTHELWFTDNGRDHLGDNLPPDELNYAPKTGMDFGFPYRYGKNVSDPEYGSKAPSKAVFTPCAMPLGPHVASLGMKFYTGNMFPSEYKNKIFICEHGSWNRSKKIGYRISTVTLDGNKALSYEPFMSGFLQKEENWGRPVDVIQLKDGSMLVSDDFAGAIYRITYKK
ncbi:MAG: PQQ-dependent sugar dehydrogenase [Candidatus Melainabacteria bacterium]|nr:PQQ-dependent sugar dehydrogenase [Candidatus Melainabacteria bacterium]